MWVADHLTLKTQVAVKFILAGRENEADARERFSREAEAAAQVKSPHVAQIFDHGVTDDGIPFIVMELLEGEDLGRHLQRNHRVQLREAAAIVTQVCRALGRAHAKGLVHRDVKPANIFLCDVGTPERFVKLLDFGVAKVMGTDPASVTKSGSITGTPAYMAPEQLLGNKDIDHRADLFSVAILAYELLTGRRPVVEDTAVAIALRIHTKGMPLASEGMPELSPELVPFVDEWFAKAWAIDPKDRYDSATPMAEEFDVLVRRIYKEQGFPSQPPFLAPLPLSGSGAAATVRDVSERTDVATLASGRGPAPLGTLSSSDRASSSSATLPAAALHTESPLSRTPPPTKPSQDVVAQQRANRHVPLLVGAVAVLAIAIVVLARRGPEPAKATAPAPSMPAPTVTAPVLAASSVASTPASSLVASATASVAPTTVAPPPTPSAKKVGGGSVGSAKATTAPSVSAAPSAAPTKKLEDIE
ncbi:MAG: protein kinase [Myxococcales bacterium]|nr:protein kinase [Myxococcales bacterium]